MSIKIYKYNCYKIIKYKYKYILIKIANYINITIHKDLGDENYDNSQKIKKR